MIQNKKHDLFCIQNELGVTYHGLYNRSFFSFGQWFDGVKEKHGENLRAEPLLFDTADLWRLCQGNDTKRWVDRENRSVKKDHSDKFDSFIYY